MSLFLDIGTGTGLSGATGVRPFLPPLLAGALARGDIGIDFDGTGYTFLESEWFLLAVLAGAVLAYVAERSVANRGGDRGARGRAVDLALAVCGLVLGALLFAGALADGGHEAWPGIVAGVACAALAWVAVGGLVERVRGRLDDSAAALLTAYADGAALVLAAIAILLPPLSFLALIGFVVLIAGGRRREGEKYAGLRILR
ncbi:MAG TPA: hypothetical protein VGF25_09435 [Thermoleophilaceae bacterium]|jgi:hypothetical protein